MTIIFGIYFFLTGISAITLKKYPGKNKSLQKLKVKFENIDEKRVAKFDGIFSVLAGMIFLGYGVYDIKNNRALPIIFILVIAVLCIVYYPLRKKYLNLK